MTSDFLLLISHGWAVTFPDSHRSVFTFCSWLDLLGVVLAFWISILKISKLLQNYLHRVKDITNFEKKFGMFFRSYSELLSKFGDISFQEYVTKGISHPVFYGDLVYKFRRVKDTPNFISSGSKIVKRLRRRQYDPLIIERTIGLVRGPSTAVYGPFLKHCTLTNKAIGTIWQALSKPPQRRQGSDLRPLWLLVGTQPSDLSSLSAGRRIACPIRMSLYIFLPYHIYYLCFTCIDFYDLSAWDGCWFVVYIRRFIY